MFAKLVSLARAKFVVARVAIAHSVRKELLVVINHLVLECWVA